MEEWTVERHLEGHPREFVDLYHRFIDVVSAVGPFEYAVAKSAITLTGTRRGFAGAKLDSKGLKGYLDLQRAIEGDPRILRAEPYTKRLFVHHFRITDPSQFDDEFAGWVREAYAVGQGAHLT